jgi:hypothetical protein
MRSVTHVLTIVMIVTQKHKVRFFTHITSFMLEQISVVSTAANESILAPLSKQTEPSHSPREIRHLTTSH